jgi:predicted esterase
MFAARRAGFAAAACLASAVFACASAHEPAHVAARLRPGLGSAASVGGAALGHAGARQAQPACRALAPGMHAHDAPTGTIHVAVPENATTCSPIYVALHGAGSSVLGVCARLAPLAEVVAPESEPAVMLCPTGNLAYDDGVADWQGPAEARAAHLDTALEHIAGALGLRAPSEHAIALLAGFSRGGFVARDVAYLRPGRYERLLVIGAAFVPDVARWLDSGVARAIFAAPDFDGAATTMRHAALRTAASGLPSRFVSLGPHWHDLPEGSAERLEASLRWSLAGASAALGGAALGSAQGEPGRWAARQRR